MFARQRSRHSVRSSLFLLVACVAFALSFAEAIPDTNTVNFVRRDHRNLRSLQEQQDVVKNIQVELRNISSPLNDAETVQFEVILSNWMDDFFMRGGSGRVRDFSSTVTVQSQTVSDDGALLVTYEALTVYTPTTEGATARNLVLLPYLNIFFNAGLIGALRSQIPSLAVLPTRTISVPLLLEDPVAIDLPTRAPVSMAPLSSTPVTIPVTVATPVTTAPTTSDPTTQAPITSAPVTSSPTTSAPTTNAPVTVAPTTAPVTTPVTMAPVTSSPTLAPAEIPTTFAPTTAAPVTMAPVTLAPVTMAPVTVAPVMVGLVPSSTITTATSTPTLAPQPQTTSPTTNGTLVTVKISDVAIEFPRGVEMTDAEETQWEAATKKWWEQYYADQQSTALQDVEATFDLKSQWPTGEGNTVILDADLSYRDFGELDDPNIVMIQPFLDDGPGYVDELRSENVRAFTIAEPSISVAIGRAPPEPKKGNGGLIAGMLFLLLFILAVVGLVTYYSVRAKERRRLQGPSQNATATEGEYARPLQSSSSVPLKSDISTLGGGSDPYDNKDAQSYDMNSLATSNFDYDKVGAANAPQSKASDSRPDASSMASSKSYPESEDLQAQEDQFVIYAPAGRLGLVVDNPDEGAPVIHSIKPDSVLIDQIQVGDRLIGVDEVDVSALSPVKVSKLISKRSTNPLRKLTLTRRTEGDDGTVLSYGKTTDSNVDTMSRMSGMESGVDTMSRMSGAESGLDTMSRTSGVDTDMEGEGDQMFSSDDETSFIGSMSRVSGDSQSNAPKEDG